MPIRRGPTPKTGGLLTFIGAPTGTIEELTPGMFGVFGVPYDVSAPDQLGPRLAPKAYRETSTYFQMMTAQDATIVEINSRLPTDTNVVRDRVRDLGDLPVSHVDWEIMSSFLRDAAKRISGQGAVPIALGGDHFIACALAQGYREAMMEQGSGRIGYIQLSSRLDLGLRDPAWGDVWRGATVRRLLDSGTVHPKNLVWIGANGYVPLDQWQMANRLPATMIDAEQVRRRGIPNVIAEALERASDGCSGVFVGVDIDVMDGGYVAMTGTPRFDGLRNVDLFEALTLLARGPVGGVSLCGLNPLIETMSLAKTGQRCGVEMLVRFIDEKIRTAEAAK